MQTLLAGLTIVLPCLDEEDNLRAVVREARAAARRVAAECEIIVVDDGSADATAVIAAAEPGVRCIRHPHNRGPGAAVRSGLRAARMPYVLLADADRQFDLHQVSAMVGLLEGADIVVGRRREVASPLAGRIAAGARRRSLRRIAPLPVRDPECSLKLLRREVLDGLRLRCDGRELHAELLIKCILAGAAVCEVSVDQRPRRAGGRRHRWLSEASIHHGELGELRGFLADEATTP